MSWLKPKRLLEKGDTAPDFQLARLDGQVARLADILAKGPAVLAFFKISCPVCQLTFPFLERIHAAGTLPIYGVSQNGAGETNEFNRRFGVTFPTLLDSEDGGFPASNAFGIATVPTIFLVERDGAISRVAEGWSRRDIGELGLKAGVEPFRQDEAVPEWKAG